MRRLFTLIGICVLSAITLTSFGVGQNRPGVHDPRAIIDALEEVNRQAPNLESFGHSIAKEAIRQTIEQIKTGHSPDSSFTIDLSFEMNLFERYIPHPDEIDICWELCPSGKKGETFLECYANCNNEIILGGARLFETCDTIREKLRNKYLSQLERVSLLNKLLLYGCERKYKVDVTFKIEEK